MQTLESARRQVDRANQLLMPRDREAVGHAGNEVADRSKLLDPIAAPLPPPPLPILPRTRVANPHPTPDSNGAPGLTP